MNKEETDKEIEKEARYIVMIVRNRSDFGEAMKRIIRYLKESKKYDTEE